MTYLMTLPESQNPSLYLLSALAQSQAAIFAIVIGLNSIALQQTATNYSSRVTKFFTNDSKYLWGLFGFSIFYDLIIMIMLPSSLTKVHYIPILLAILFAMFAYNNMIEYIHENITVFSDPIKFIYKLNENNNVGDEHDDIKNVEFFDFIVGSLKIYDYNSYKEGLSLYYKNELNEIYSNKDASSNNHEIQEKFNYIISRFILIGDISISTRNDTATLWLVESVYTIFSNIQDKDRKRQYFVDSLEQISEFIEHCAKNELEKATISGITGIYNIYDITSDTLSRAVILRALINIGKISSEMKLERSTIEAITYIGLLIDMDLSIKNRMEITRKSLTAIGFIALNSAENKLEAPCEKALLLISKFSIETINQRTENTIDSAIDIIGKITIPCIINGFKDCVNLTIESYQILKKNIKKEGSRLELIEKIEGWELRIQEKKKEQY